MPSCGLARGLQALDVCLHTDLLPLPHCLSHMQMTELCILFFLEAVRWQLERQSFFPGLCGVRLKVVRGSGQAADGWIQEGGLLRMGSQARWFLDPQQCSVWFSSSTSFATFHPLPGLLFSTLQLSCYAHDSEVGGPTCLPAALGTATLWERMSMPLQMRRLDTQTPPSLCGRHWRAAA